MAVEFSSTHTRTSVYEFFPEDIEIRPELNGRHDKPDVEWLIADILKNGQIQPVSVWSDAGTAVLAAGFSRWRAISEINKRGLTPNPLKLRANYVKTNEKGAFIRNISENRMRNETTAVDDAHNIQHLIEVWQMDEVEVAKIYFPVAATEDEIKEAVKWVRGRIDLIKLTPEAEKAVTDGRLNETAAAAIAKLSAAQQRKALGSKEGKLSAKDIKASAPKPAKPAKPAKIDPELKRRITAVIETADFDEWGKGTNVWIEVTGETLLLLKSYIEESK